MGDARISPVEHVANLRSQKLIGCELERQYARIIDEPVPEEFWGLLELASQPAAPARRPE